MPNLFIEVKGSLDGNAFDHAFEFMLNADVEAAAKEAMAAAGIKPNPDGGYVYDWQASQNVPLDIPVNVLGIKTHLHEVLALAEEVKVTLS